MNFVYNNNNNSNSNSGRQYMVKSNSTPRSSPNKMERVSFMQQEKNDDSDIYGHQSSIIMDDSEATMFPNYPTPSKTFPSHGIRASFSSASPILTRNSNNSHKRKSRSEAGGRLENKRFIRDIANGLDKMAIKVRSPPPPSPHLEKNWMNQYYNNNNDNNNGNNGSAMNSNRKQILQLRHVAPNTSNNALVPGAIVNRKLFNRQQNHNRNEMKQQKNNNYNHINNRYIKMNHNNNNNNNNHCATDNNSINIMSYQADEEDSDTISGSPIKPFPASGIVPKRIVQLRDEDSIFKTLFEHEVKCRSVLNSIN